MAKLNKSEAVAAAKNLARSNATANAMTITDINALDWDARRQLARKLTDTGTANRIDTHAQYQPAVREAYEDAILSIWGAKIKDQQNARCEFAQACKGLTADEARAKIAQLVDSFKIRGRRNYTTSGVTLDVERAWGVAGALYITLERDHDNAIVNPDDENQRAYRYRVETKLSWSSTGRTIAEALASTKLYTELIEVAAEVEAVMNHERIVYVYGLPEPVVVSEAVDSTRDEPITTGVDAMPGVA